MIYSNISVWSGRLKRSQIRAIEKIQMRATEMIEGMSYIDYGERLELLHLPTLSYRRARGEMIEVWKHYHVYDPNVISPTFQGARSRRKMYQIQRLRPGDGVRGGQSWSFYYLAPVAWNNLPVSVMESNTICKVQYNNEIGLIEALLSHHENTGEPKT